VLLDPTAKDYRCAQKTPFWGAIFILETIALPRQARDKHAGKFEGEGVFLQPACQI
jgi:hypothetical protein